MRYWEDFTVGETTDLGTVDVTREEIVEFAQRYDPQPFHLDEAAAERRPVRRADRERLAHRIALHGPVRAHDPARRGVDGLARRRGAALDGAGPAGRPPDRPRDGDRVRAFLEAPDRGTVFTTSEVLNQDGTVVMTMKARGFFGRRDPAS